MEQCGGYAHEQRQSRRLALHIARRCGLCLFFFLTLPFCFYFVVFFLQTFLRPFALFSCTHCFLHVTLLHVADTLYEQGVMENVPPLVFAPGSPSVKLQRSPGPTIPHTSSEKWGPAAELERGGGKAPGKTNEGGVLGGLKICPSPGRS